jgi:thiamine-phosphate pyrophosphorylase
VSFPRLYAILDVEYTSSVGRDPLTVASTFFSAGVRLIQVRSKALGSGALLELSSQVVEAARPHGAIVIVNDRPDIAVLAGAAGVHVGQEDLPPDAVRRVMPDGIVGLSTHTREQFELALATPATYLAVGPVFGTSTKDTGYAAVGLDLLMWAARRSDRPVVAIGGITLDNIAEVFAAGASSAAVISDLVRGDPRERARVMVARAAG